MLSSRVVCMDYSADLQTIAQLLRGVVFSLGFVGGVLVISLCRGRWF